MCIRDRSTGNPQRHPMAAQGFAGFIHPPTVFFSLIAAATLLQCVAPRRFLHTSPGARLPYAVAVLAIAGGTVLAAFSTFAAQGEHPSHLQDTNTLVSDGPLAYMRSPFYVGFVLGLVGLGLLTDSVYQLLGAACMFLYLHLLVVPAEELFMAAQFGEQWSDYVSRVPRWGLF
eukprot:TRINITY_DN14381_c0_g1_i1.p2 TRINITY_DN14381_c0_g1~~TRINITY_DN14381_c0_g1_i1.p2  ORF type:complete len:173 (-),score=49.02 TRINITY_DN14381_c0_g1_i1:262-780(-)